MAMGLVWFGNQVKEKVIDIFAAKAEQAGREGVRVAREHVPYRTGRLSRSIGYIWSRKELRLRLYADEPYALWVERRTPYLRPGAAAMGRIFGSRTEIQFATLPEKYHARARQINSNSRRTIFGHRNPGKFG